MAKKRQERIPSVLFEGDSIEISVSHELKIDGESNWVSYKVFSRVDEGETSQQAHDRVMTHINNGVQSLVEETVRNIQEMSG